MEVRAFSAIVLLIVAISNTSKAMPVQEADAFLYDTNYLQYYQPKEDLYPIVTRRVRSPNGEINVNAQHTTQQGGNAKAEYNHRLWQNGGAHLDANAYYQRNWGNSPGPRKDYGGGLQLTVPLGRH